jgi:hypothetical protein
VFDPRDGSPTWAPEPGSNVSVIVEVDTGRFGLSGVFQREVTASDVKSLPVASAAPAFDLAGSKG